MRRRSLVGAVALSAGLTSGLLASAPPASTAAAAPTLSRTPFGAGLVGLAPARGAGFDPRVAGSAVLAGKLLFTAATGAHGAELWSTDGTPAGTRMVKDLAPGTTSSLPRDCRLLGGRVWFSATDAAGDRELWSTDGTERGTRRAFDLSNGNSADPEELTVVGNLLYFTARYDAGVRALWRTTGTLAGTAVAAVNAPADPQIADLTAFGDRLLFSADQGEGRHVFATRGAPQTTVRLDVEHDTTQLGAGFFRPIGDRVVFRAGNAASGAELWVTRGSDNDARGIKDILPGPEGSLPREFTRSGATAVFAADGVDGAEPWITDGTAGGTQQLRDIRSGDAGSGPQSLLRVGEEVYFSADDGVHGRELWRTRGTVSSTRLVRDVLPGAAGSTATPIGALGRRVLYLARSAGTGFRPWTHDPVTGGHRLIADLAGAGGNTLVTVIGRLGDTAILDVEVAGGHRIAAFTATPSRTVARPRPSYARAAARSRTIRVPVSVTADGRAAAGAVTFVAAGRVIGRASLIRGSARVRVTAGLRPGRHTVRVVYAGSVRAQSSRSTFVLRVR